MTQLPSLWRCLEELPGLNAVPLVWRTLLGPQFPAFQTLCLQTTSWLAQAIPCPLECGCWHHILADTLPACPSGRTSQHLAPLEGPPAPAPGPIRAICRCDPPDCPDLQLTLVDITPLQVNRARLGRALCQALLLDNKPANLGLPLSPQIGSWSANAVPVILTIHHEGREFRADLADLVAELAQPFILLAPTALHLNAHLQSLLAHVHAACFSLDAIVRLTPQGTLLPTRPPGELFAQFRPQPKDSLAETVARQTFALAKALDAECTRRKASPLAVFLFYCRDGLSVAEIARRCRCTKPVIFARLKWLETRLGRKPAELRQFSEQFQKIEQSLPDPRARRIYRQGAIYGAEEEEAGS